MTAKSPDLLVAPEPKDSHAAFAKVTQRFVTLAAQQSWRRVDPPRALTDAAVREISALDPARFCIDADREPDVAARTRLAIAAAYAQGGETSVRALVQGVTATVARVSRGSLWHGTGSWALRGILEQGALVPGGDGLTGEVALTHLRSSDLYLCVGGSPLALYAAATFAYQNCAWDGRALELSAVRAGAAPVTEFFSVLMFADAEPCFSEATRRLDRLLVRYRTLAMEESVARAAARALELAQGGLLPGDGREYTRSLAGPENEQSVLANVMSAVVERMQPDATIMRTPAATRLAAGVLRYVPDLQRELWCPLPDDDDARRDHKLAVLRALEQQYPCILELDPDGVGAHPDPSYAFSPERLVPHAIPARSIRCVHVPQARVTAVAQELIAHGLEAEVASLEDFEATRFVAEAT